MEQDQSSNRSDAESEDFTLTQVSFSNPGALWVLVIFLPLLALPFMGHGVRSERIQRFRRLYPRQWFGLILRLLIGLGLILSLAGAQLVRPVEDVTVVFVLDLSDSIPQSEQDRAESYIRQAIAAMPEKGQAAIVAFGGDALVERLASGERNLASITSVPNSTQTDIAAAVRLGLALFPNESQKRLFLLTDGLENKGDVLSQLDLLAARGVEIAVLPLAAPLADQEALVAELETPAAVRQGQNFAVTAVIESAVAQEAMLHLFGDHKLLTSQAVSLRPGINRVQLSVKAKEAGFRRYQVELVPSEDKLSQNNLASGFTIVHGPPRVLLIEGALGSARNLSRALTSAGMEVIVMRPAALPNDLAELNSFDAVVLVDVAAGELPQGAMRALPVYVRELGRGLVMVGGEDSYGAGGYLRTPLEEALPVDMDVRSRTKEPNVALVLAVDKSGSMGRCHCDDPDALPGQYERVETGLPKVDIAKDAILKASNMLGPLDYLGVVAFDENALWALTLQQLVDAPVLQSSIGGLQAEGQTNIFAGLSQAEEALLETQARVKHIILLTDGWSLSGNYAELTARLAEEGITLSVVAAGGGSAEYLEGLAQSGGGRYYPAPSMQSVPQIFLKETIQAVGSYIIEEPFYPLPAGTTPILQGLDPAGLPPLLGYNGTTPKDTAQVPLLSSRGDPLLAQWQYGLGRAVAWTSDLQGQWAADWVTWERFNIFAAQLVGWTLPDPQESGLEVALDLDGMDVQFQVDSMDKEGRHRDLLETEATLIGPEGVYTVLELEQTAAGHYEGEAGVTEPGTYLIQVVQRDQDGRPMAQQTSGLVVPYSPEYKRLGEDTMLLNDLVQATGGSVLDDPRVAFTPTRQPARQTRSLWPFLLLAATLLFPLDVAVRRLRLTRSDWDHLTGWIRDRMPRRISRQQTNEPVLLGDLFAARARARRRGVRPAEAGEKAVSHVASGPNADHKSIPRGNVQPERKQPVDRGAVVEGQQLQSSAGREHSQERNESKGEALDTLARLRQARERARRRE